MQFTIVPAVAAAVALTIAGPVDAITADGSADTIPVADPTASEATQDDATTSDSTLDDPSSPSAQADSADPAGCTTDCLAAPATADYWTDGVQRPFWWESDGLHFRDPIPANGYVNINVPGAQNLNIDVNRDLIGATFVPWERFGLTEGMCVTWTESNGYDYHFGEDNSGRGGVDERGWTVCVPSTDPDPDPTPEPTPDPTPEPTPDPTPEPTPEPAPEPDPEPAEEPDPAVQPDSEADPDPAADPADTTGTEPETTAPTTTTAGAGSGTAASAATTEVGTGRLATTGVGLQVANIAVALVGTGLTARALRHRLTG